MKKILKSPLTFLAIAAAVAAYLVYAGKLSGPDIFGKRVSKGDTLVVLGNCVDPRSQTLRYLNEEQVTISAFVGKGEIEGLRRSTGESVVCELARITVLGKVKKQAVLKVSASDPLEELDKKIILATGKCGSEMLIDEVVDVLSVDARERTITGLKRLGKKMVECPHKQLRFEVISQQEAMDLYRLAREAAEAKESASKSKQRLLSGTCFKVEKDPSNPKNTRITRVDAAKSLVVLVKSEEGKDRVNLMEGAGRGAQLLCDREMAAYILEEIPAGTLIKREKTENQGE